MLNWKKWICALLAAALCLGLWACQKEETPSSSQEESSAVSQEPSPTPEITPEPESSSFSLPAQDLIPPEENDLSDEFGRAFSQNPIDRQYDAEYAEASSFAMIRTACDNAARRWKNMTESAYEAALEVLDSAARGRLREEQAQWIMDSETEIELLRQKDTGSNESVVTMAQQIVLLYRDRAKELCRVYYDATGSLPDFPDVEAAAAG